MGDGWHEIDTPGNVSIIQVHSEVRNSVASADEIEPGIWWVSRVLVHRKHRGEGLGKRMVARLLALCGGQKASEVRVAPGGYDNDTERQRGFYAACGFVPVDDGGLMTWKPT